MITYIDAQNANKYHLLFKKASLALGQEETFISTLDQYFSHLEELAELDSQNAGKQSFLRLPLDEDVFEIDADARTISIPASFAKNGISVQGDEIAEVLYFTIDRYFDATDLATNDMKIAIQWETNDKSGLSAAYGKDVESVPGKILFGWPISSELTAAAGAIKFAVRFFKGDTFLTYSFSTLPAEVSIKATLDHDVLHDTLIDHSSLIMNRISSNGIYDITAPIPADPVITFNLQAIGENAGKIIDLKEGQAILGVEAKPGTEGSIGYKLKKYGYNSNTASYSDQIPVEVEAAAVFPYYAEIKALPEDDSIELYKEGDSGYELISDINSLELGEYVEGEGFRLGGEEDNLFIKIYVKVHAYTVTSAGKYLPEISATAGVNTVSKLYSEENNIVYIPGPLKPIVSVPESIVGEDGLGHLVISDGSASLSAEVAKAEEDADEEIVGTGAADKVSLSYQWKEKDGDNMVNVAGATNAELVLSGLEDENFDKYYQLEVTSHRNGEETSATSGLYRVTQMPKVPTLMYRIFNGSTFVPTETDYHSENNKFNILKSRGSNQYAKLSFSIDKDSLGNSDELAYIWMRVNVQEDVSEDFDENGFAKLQIDLDNQLADLFPDNPTGDADFPVSGVFEFVPIEELGAIVADADNGPSLQLNADSPTGTYYCIVINTLNNYRKANVSPFFVVS